MPSRHIEATTRAGYQAYLNKQFYPVFENRQMGKILPSDVQGWVTTAAAGGLSAASIRKCHVMLHSVFARAVRDRIIAINTCEETQLPKVITTRARTLTPDEYRRLLDAFPDRHRLIIQTAVETGVRWGELIALRPRHLDLVRSTLSVEETIVEVPQPRRLAEARPWWDEPAATTGTPPVVDAAALEAALDAIDGQRL